MDRLRCLFCDRTFSFDPFSLFCPDCREPLLFDPAALPEKPKVRGGCAPAVERYLDFLPLTEYRADLGLGEGNTPLLALHALGEDLGIPLLFAKDESRNPTGSFKDRGSAVAVPHAATLGFGRIGTVSTGNMAGSTAAYGARLGLKTVVVLKEGAPSSAVLSAGIYGPTLVTIRGDYGRLFHESLEVGRVLGIYFMNSVDPFRIEGYKVTGLEIFSQLGDRAPRFVLVPVSSGGHFVGLMRAFEALERAGRLPRFPTFVGVQPAACAPIVRAFESGLPKVERVPLGSTIAHAISTPAPPAGNAVLELVRKKDGLMLSVSDEEMLEAQRTLAVREGLFCQPESGAALAGLKRLAAQGGVGPDDTAVLVLTGGGLKATAALQSRLPAAHEVRLEELGLRLRSLVG
jgi:threonine synthase